MSYEHGPLIQRAKLDFNSNAAAGNELVAAVEGHHIRVLQTKIMAARDVGLSFYSAPADTGTEIDAVSPIAERLGFLLPAPPDPKLFWFQTEKGEALTGLLDGAVACTGPLIYYTSEED